MRWTIAVHRKQSDMNASHRSQPDRVSSEAFTLTEILVVVVILAIIAAIVIPQFKPASEATRTSALLADLKSVRGQLALYMAQHTDNPPSLAEFADQMTIASNVSGETAAPGTAGYPFGPYIGSVPKNPFTLTNTVGGGAVGSSDWYYDQATGAFHANDSVENRAH